MNPRASAFSLVELSIVLVILGLLTGGILAGQSLIRASELRAATTEYTRYVTAVQTFRDKYFALPGDMPNATLVWGKGSACPASIGVAATPGTCNGDGNGTVSATGALGDYNELLMFWQQMQLAGLLEGSLTGMNASTDSKAIAPGVNAPVSKVSNGSWSLGDWANTAGDTIWLNMGNTVQGVDRLYLGQIGYPSGLQFANHGPLINPPEMWNIDTKIDDGKPTQGRLRAVNIGTCTTVPSGTDPGIATADYLLSTTAVGCALMFDNNGKGFFTM